jgi:hypothetical protein
MPQVIADARETQISPPFTNPSSRAATFTPSPKMSPSLIMTSPALMPMRNRIGGEFGSASFAAAIAFWISAAQETASRMLTNSASTLSPAVFAIRPRRSTIRLSTTSRRADNLAIVASSSACISRL